MVDATADLRLQPDPKLEARRDRIYGSRRLPRFSEPKRDVEDEQESKEAVMAEIERYVNDFVLNLLAQRVAQAAQARKAQKARIPVVQKCEPGTQKVKIAGREIRLHDMYQQLRRDGYSGKDAAAILGHYL